MTEPTITCPKCKTEIKLTESIESLAAPLIDSALRMERTRIAADESRKAKLTLGVELDQKAKQVADLEDILKQRDAKLVEAQKAQAEVIRKQRELEDAKREIDLTVEKRVQESLGAARDRARKEAEDGLNLKIAEKERTITSMAKQMEELRRKAEQGSEQIQGEVLELELEGLLRGKFPHDAIEPVAKGEHGGDVLHRVVGPLGQACGTILWESKRTKNWSDGWLAKLREDHRAAKAEVAVIISQALPKGVETFEWIDGVWVAHPRVAIPVAVALRQSLIEVTAARLASEGQQTKMGKVYRYLTGPLFRQRVEAIIEAFSSMNEDLDKEKKAILRLWEKRKAQIDNVMQATVGMYGDLQGIAGRTLQEIEGLELPGLPGPASDGKDPIEE